MVCERCLRTGARGFGIDAEQRRVVCKNDDACTRRLRDRCVRDPVSMIAGRPIERIEFDGAVGFSHNFRLLLRDVVVVITGGGGYDPDVHWHVEPR
jgi:hypothetical protein